MMMFWWLFLGALLFGIFVMITVGLFQAIGGKKLFSWQMLLVAVIVLGLAMVLAGFIFDWHTGLWSLCC